MVALLLALSALLIGFQYITLAKFGVLPPAVKHTSFDGFSQAAAKVVSLGTADTILASLIVATALCLVLVELWGRRLSAFLDMVFQTEKRTLVALGATSLLAVRYYLSPGELSWAADTSVHTAYAWVASQAISHGELPIWTNYFATGSPFLQFYGFLFFYCVGLADLFLGDVVLSIKLVMAGAHVLSGIGMYLLVRTVCGSRGAGFLAGMGFVLTMWHTQQVLIMGRLPLSVFYALLPWPFYFFEQVCAQSRKLLPAMGGGIVVGLLAFTHPGYGFWAALFLLVYVAVRLWGIRGRHGFRQLLLPSSLLVGEGLVFGAYLTIPMWLERAHTGLRFGVSMSQSPDPTWQQLLVWSNFRFPLFSIETTHWYGGYLGLSLALLSMVGLGYALVSRARSATPAALAGGVGLILSLVLVFGYRWPVIGSLSVVQAFNSGRYLLFVVFFMSLMAGLGAASISRRWTGEANPNRVFALLLLLLGLDLGTTTFQQPYLASEPVFFPAQTHESLRQHASQIPDGRLPSYRIFYGTRTVYRLKIISWLPVKTGTPTFMGVYNELPLAMAVFGNPLEQMLNPVVEEIEDPNKLAASERFDLLAAGLCLLNTKYIFAIHTDKKTFLSWSMPTATPIVVSPRIVGWELPVVDDPEEAQGGLTAMLAAMDLNPQTATCRQILLTDYVGEEDLGTSPTVEVLEHSVWNQRVELRVRVSDPCFARLAYAHYPHLGVTVDGESIVPYQTAGRFIALRLDAGEHRIVLEPHLSPIRRGLFSLDLVLLALAITLFIRERNHRGKIQDQA